MQKIPNIAGKALAIIGVVIAVALALPRAALAQNSPVQQPYAAQQPAAPQQQAGPSCIYPNGASCPMAMAAAPGMSCACQQSWAGTGVVANGAANGVPQQPGTMAPGSTASAQPTLQTPPPPANMVPIP